MGRINYWDSKYNESLRQADYKQAEKYCDKLFKLDSARDDVYYKKAEVLYWQYRFDEAIENFDKALKIEPFFRSALAGRGIARMKKYQFSGTEKFTKTQKNGLIYSWYAPPLPKEEQEKVCSDLQLAVEINYNNTTSGNIIEAIRVYCKNKN